MKDFILKNKWLIFITLGAINALPFTFEALFFVSWLSFAPFFAITARLSEDGAFRKKTFLYIFLFFFSFHFCIYHFFMALVPMDFIGMSVIPSFFLMLFAWLALSAAHAIAVTLAVWFVYRLKLSSANKIFAASLVIVLMQYFLSLGTYGFTWARVSLPQSAVLPLIQSASLLGPYFVDLILMLVNASLAVAFITKKYNIFLTSAVAVFVINFIFGFVYMSSDIETAGDRHVDIVQGNVLMDQKWNSPSSYSVYFKETLYLEDKDSMVVWAETAIPTDLNESVKIKSEIEAYTLYSGKELITGAFYCSDIGKSLNGAYYIADGKMSDKVYFKRRLVPFGEFLPMRSLLQHFPVLKDINLLSTDLFPGDSTYVMNTRYGNVGCLVCFDSIFSQLARESTKDGAELLVIMTNDSWYKDHSAVYQHNNQAKWRAVENGRYVVRAANSGISSFITPHGEVTASLPPLIKGTISQEVSFIEKQTLYTKVGDVIICPIILILSIYLVTAIKDPLKIKIKNFRLFNGS